MWPPTGAGAYWVAGGLNAVNLWDIVNWVIGELKMALLPST